MKSFVKSVSKLTITFVAFGVPFTISVIKRPLSAAGFKCEKMRNLINLSTG